MTTEPERAVTAGQAELRRTLDVGQARVDGQLALLAQRSDQHDRDVADLMSRVSTMQHSRWPLPSVAALTSLCALGVAAWQALGH
ncbi:hypothetical protein [Streptomyces sp. H27-D2]|uniref:hypothetical protein n=1 Tax=Streptomyces sp. H27-D2 TaxID=3046304 RepID=UPI002DBC2BCB|nr:hypothetical protein [Streptomyces sp. H27-D2]MEC4020436.1 hypothetical protein [Streptomyces sp. H27-D2]